MPQQNQAEEDGIRMGGAIGARYRKAWGADVDWKDFSKNNETDREKREAADLADAYVLSSLPVSSCTWSIVGTAQLEPACTGST